MYANMRAQIIHWPSASSFSCVPDSTCYQNLKTRCTGRKQEELQITSLQHVWRQQMRFLTTRDGIQVIAQDQGPGIHDVQQALRDGFSTSGSLRLGLPGVKRLMDEFQIDSKENQGTTVVVKKWKKLGNQ